jgi:hypothetical protein
MSKIMNESGSKRKKLQYTKELVSRLLRTVVRQLKKERRWMLVEEDEGGNMVKS